MEDERIRLIMGKLYAKASLTAGELSELQTHVDLLETQGRAGTTNHHSQTSPNSHHSHHVTSVAAFTGILEQVKQRE